MVERVEAQSLFDGPGAGAPEPTAADHTWGVAEIHAAANSLFEERFGARMWVTGELRSLNKSTSGHTYFDLVEFEPEGDNRGYDTPKLNVTLFAGRRRRVNSRITDAGGKVGFEDGTVLRIQGELRTYGARSTLQLLMTDIDPAYTLGVVGQKREMVLATLASEGLLQRNAALPVPYPPIDLAVVTSRGSAAHADVLAELERSGIGFRVSSIDSRTQGTTAEAHVVAALRTAEELRAEVVLLVRGGGSATDLAVFDSERIARTIAGLSVPVLTGIGHETDRSVADEVAHTAHKTPTAAAAAVVATAQEARRRLEQATGMVTTAAAGSIARSERDLHTAGRNASLACRAHLDREERLLATRLDRVASAAPRALHGAHGLMDDLADRVSSTAAAALGRASNRLDGLAALVDAQDPRRMMERGWSLTHDSRGELVRSRAQLAAGERITTTLHDGSITSTVERTEDGEERP